MNKKEITLLVAVPLVSISILSIKEINVQAQEINTNSQALERPSSSIIAMYPVTLPNSTTSDSQSSKASSIIDTPDAYNTGDFGEGSTVETTPAPPITDTPDAHNTGDFGEGSTVETTPAPPITDTPDAHNTGDFAEGSTVETNSGEQGTDSSTSPTDTMYPETATPAPTEPMIIQSFT